MSFRYGISSTRLYISTLIYAIVVLVVGVPVWWMTTRVYRSLLPYENISELPKSFDDIHPKFTINIYSSISIESFLKKLNENHSPFLINQNHLLTNRQIDQLNEKSITQYHLDDIHRQIHHSDGNDLTIYLIRTNEETNFRYGFQTNTIFFHSSQFNEKFFHFVKTEIHHNFFGKKTNQLNYSPNFHLAFSLVSFFHGQRDIVPYYEWDMNKIINKFMKKTFEKYSNYFNVTFSTQILSKYETDIPISHRVMEMSQKEFYFIPLLQQSPILNSLDRHLSNVKLEKTINSIILIPTPNNSYPLVFQTDKKNQFVNELISEDWGNIIIYNQKTETISVEKYKGVLIRNFFKNLQIEMDENEIIPNEIKLQKWQIERTLNNIIGVSKTLKSLSSLLQRISNIVIRDEVEQRISLSLNKINFALTQIRNGKFSHQVYHESCLAYELSETAFYDPSLLECLYFPEDQKFAIYVPLFLPVSVPILTSLSDLFHKWKKNELW
ncbi:hypothetical protein SNEBB_007515 [Seison nebaliae]|nr:hypothetical protein SNEBB_007515 [Seison nebaliae]